MDHFGIVVETQGAAQAVSRLIFRSGVTPSWCAHRRGYVVSVERSQRDRVLGILKQDGYAWVPLGEDEIAIEE